MVKSEMQKYRHALKRWAYKLKKTENPHKLPRRGQGMATVGLETSPAIEAGMLEGLINSSAKSD